MQSDQASVQQRTRTAMALMVYFGDVIRISEATSYPSSVVQQLMWSVTWCSRAML